MYFKSDMSGRVAYAYIKDINDYGQKRSNYQWSELEFLQVNSVANQNVYDSKVYLNPAGYWYYIIYEVHFPETLLVNFDGSNYSMLAPGYAPIDNRPTYDPWSGEGPPPEGCRGQLGIAVEEGKLYVDQEPAAITYSQHTQNNDNYIYTE